MKNAIIYTRVSTAEQADSGFSLGHQKNVLERYCALKGINVIKHYREDYSAKNFDRPQFNQLLEYVKANKKRIDMLLFTRWDRFSRNQEEAYRMIRLFRNMGIEINSMEQPLDLEQPDSKIMLAVYLAVPEVENDKNSIRTKEGMRRAMREGCYVATPPFGYKRHRTADGKATMVFHEEKAPLLRKAFDEFLKGIYSAEEVRKKFYSQGLKISKSNFVLTLRRALYAGKIVIPEWRKEDEEIVEGLHEGIITWEEHLEVLRIFKNGKRQTRKKASRKELLPLRGFLECQQCGSKLTGSASTSRANGKYYYYHCQHGCKERFRADSANEKFVSLLKGFKIKPEVSRLYYKVIEDVFKTNEVDKQAQLDTIDKEVNKLYERLEKAQDNLIDEVIEPRTYKTMKKRYEGKINDLLKQQTELKFADSAFKKYLNFGLRFLQDIDIYYNEAEVAVKQKIIGSIFTENLIFDKENYRTVKTNELISLITCKSALCGGIKQKQSDYKAELSYEAPPLGLEPRTL